MLKRELQAALVAAGLPGWNTRKWHSPVKGEEPLWIAEDPYHEWTVYQDGTWVAEYVPRHAAGLDWKGRGATIKEAMRSAVEQADAGGERIAASLKEARARAQELL